MTSQSVKKRRQDLIKAMSEERGYMTDPWMYMVENDLDFIEAYNTLYTRALKDGNALPIKTRELIAMAILAYRGLTDGVYLHAKRALQHGATKQDLLEAIETTIIPGGAPTFAAGVRALIKIENEEKKGK